MSLLRNNTRLFRLERGWSLQELAAALQISVPALSKIERGITDVNLSRLEQLAHIFGVPLTALLTLETAASSATPSAPLEHIQAQLRQRDHEVMRLQQKVITLCEELALVSPLNQSARFARQAASLPA